MEMTTTALARSHGGGKRVTTISRRSPCVPDPSSNSSSVLSSSSSSSSSLKSAAAADANASLCDPRREVCVINTIGSPAMGIPHTGRCLRRKRGKYCEYNGYLFASGLTGIPSVDGCSNCTCYKNSEVVCRRLQPASCLVNPCDYAVCPGHPSATCKATYCRGCHFDFYENGIKVDCRRSDGEGAAPSLPMLDVDLKGNMKMACGCQRRVDPVCGSDGRTYANACAASCANVRFRRGRCGYGCACNRMFAPVCGSDGKTYANPCIAECALVDYLPHACGLR
ncbi:hypothetical protein CBR_g34850 [Chara braunii]|uniref:Kazal-like domain-containing protein n=1 Tax=Chara braunii TaxID=69332 RepID=A0A388LJG9_CHABU|nr:hypothetical protein CBR_g34850 [Chara braunii]|eukprot:GBG82474.1 hypothetical protein CBR_g34850 [Chara braunii]